ncbi:MAG: hypothetical protein DRN66_03180 [Candidatus Nanohalarchaeota archaeon]|nr:MAG: hypothetical protein DRN66_03180 [Candidatus Nanohaloarchaeota archaeon]
MKFKLFARLKKKASVDTDKKEVSFDRAIPTDTNDSPKEEGKYDTNIINRSTPSGDIEKEIETDLNKGMTEGDIIKNLKEKGYDYSQIDAAMTNIMQKEEKKPSTHNIPAQNFFDNSDPLLNKSIPDPNYKEPPYDSSNPYFIGEGLNIEEVEEIVNEMLYAKLNELYEFKEKTNKTLADSSKKIKGLLDVNNEIKKSFELFKKGNENEIGEMKEKLSDIVPRILSIEKAFKEIIPNIVDEQRAINAEFENIKQLEKSIKKREKI